MTGRPRVLAGALVLSVLAFAAILVYAVHLSGQRVADIEASRVASCRQTYEGIRQVFKPFFPPPGQQTPRQKRDLAKFNRTVERLKRGCDHQVHTG